MIKRLTILNAFIIIVLLGHAQVTDTIVSAIGKKIDSLQQRPVVDKITVDSSVYVPFQFSKDGTPLVKTSLKSKEITNTVKAGKKAIVFIPSDPTKDTLIINQEDEIKKQKKEFKDITPAHAITPMINLLVLDSLKRAHAFKRITVDSSVYNNHSIVKSISPKTKNDSTITDFKHQIDGSRKSIVLLPGIKPKSISISEDTLALSKNEFTQVKMKNLLEMDSLYKVSAVKKITVDSSVYKKYIPVKSTAIIQTNLKGKEITGLVLPTNKNKYFIPLPPKQQTFSEQEKSLPISANKTQETRTVVMSDVPAAVSKKILDSINNIHYTEKITLDSSVYSPKKVIQKNIPIVKTNLRAQNIIGTLLPKDPNRNVVPTELKPIVQKDILVAKPENTSKSPMEVLDTTLSITKNDAVKNIKTNLRAQNITGTLSPDKANKIIVPAEKNIIPKEAYIPKPSSFSKSPLETLDTNLIIVKKENTPIIKSNLKAQSITGTLLPDSKGISVTPATVDLKIDSSIQQNTSLINNVAASDDLPPLTGETTLPKTLLQPKTTIPVPETAIDPTKFYTVPGNDRNSALNNGLDNYSNDNNQLNNSTVKSDLKSQTITTGTLLPKSGQPITVQPITLDSIASIAAASNANNAVVVEPPPPVSTYSVPSNNPSNSRIKIVNDNIPASKNNNLKKEADLPKIDITRNKNAYSAPSYSISGMKYNFYLSQNGKYVISFYTRDFSLNISQTGQLSDLSVVQSGKVSNASISRVSRVGNLSVNYNEKGQMNGINDVAIDYGGDGKVSRIGDIPITYTYDGLIDKVGDVKIFYNTNGSVYLIDHYKVSYNYDGVVTNIDDSKGLIIFKATIK